MLFKCQNFHVAMPLSGLAICLLLLALAINFGAAIRPATAQTNSETANNSMGNKERLVIRTKEADHIFSIEVADTDDERATGLMYRTQIAPDYGMLFDFEKTEQVYMWMKNTYISLDMLFIDKQGVIRHIVKNTTPLSQTIISSGGPVRYVLEVESGTSERLGLRRGDQLVHQLFTPNKAK